MFREHNEIFYKKIKKLKKKKVNHSREAFRKLEQ